MGGPNRNHLDVPTKSPATPTGILRAETWILAGILLLAGVLRLVGIGDQSFWCDEFYSFEHTTGRGLQHLTLTPDRLLDLPAPTSLDGAPPWWRIPSEMDRDTHPPLYFILLRFWRDAFGSSESVARLLSAILSVLGVGLMYGAARAWLGRASGLPAAGLMALAPMQVIYAQETRSYALALAFSIGAIWAVACIRNRGPAWHGIWSLFGCVLGMLLTHYFSFGAVAGLGLYALVGLRGKNRAWMTGTLVLAGLLFAGLWLPMLLRQTHQAPLDYEFLRETAAAHLPATLDRLGRLPIQWLFKYAPPSPWSVLLLPIYILPAFWVRRRPSLLLPWLWMLGTVGFVLFLDLARVTRHLEFVRYTIFAVPGVYLLIAACVSEKRFRPWLVPSMMTILTLIVLPSAYEPSKEPWKLSAAIMADSPGSEPLVIPLPGMSRWYSEVMYLGLAHYGGKRPVLLLSGKASDELLLELKQRSSSVWVASAAPGMDPGQMLPGATPEGAWVIPGIGMLWRVRLP